MNAVFLPPVLNDSELEALKKIEVLRSKLGSRVGQPTHWVGGLRRTALARAVQASNSIEGYDATLDDVKAVVDGDDPIDADAESQQAISGYRDAMTYVLQLAHNNSIQIDESLLKSLHFMMLKYDLSKHPGNWRPGAIYIRKYIPSEQSSQIVYEAPNVELVPELIALMVDQIRHDQSPLLVRAAMAHLNLAMIHPFSDGNGRMARCLQSLVLAEEQLLAPAFSSIEEYLGHNTDAYYKVLADVGRGKWSPENDARPWIRFCLTAHYLEVSTLLNRVNEAEELWSHCSEIVATRKLPERCIEVLCEAAYGFRLRNSAYRAVIKATRDEDISELTASRDLKLLVDAKLLLAEGERRGRRYMADDSLAKIWQGIRSKRKPLGGDELFDGF